MDGTQRTLLVTLRSREEACHVAFQRESKQNLSPRPYTKYHVRVTLHWLHYRTMLEDIDMAM